jgi:hypothetical protein
LISLLLLTLIVCKLESDNILLVFFLLGAGSLGEALFFLAAQITTDRGKLSLVPNLATSSLVP